mmetsp:Transcript_148056/g.210263  ORF Transcript_148056/g.210263 Transcript_148056/m.210263 type:complete len:309 (-) Transcript_148056:6-932(-)
MAFTVFAAVLATTVDAAVPSTRLNDGTYLPMVSLGTGYNSSATETDIKLALQAGFRSIDTAFDYFDQVGVGKGIKDAIAGGIPRTDLYVITKVPACLTAHTDKYCADLTKGYAKTNLRQLGLDSVNLLLVHYTPLEGCKNCDPIKAQWGAMEELLAENVTRTIGVSNYCKECLECLADAKVQPAVNQIEYHVGMGADPEGIISYTKSKGIVPQAYSPLGPTMNHTAKNILIEGNLTTSIGRHYNKSGAQVALHWVNQHEAALITKAPQLEYLQEDISIFDFELNDADLAALDAATEPKARPCLFCTST